MISCDLRGGLGNQLFQIFITISTALKYKTSFSFLHTHELGGGGRTKRFTYWTTFLKSLSVFTKSELPFMHYHLNEEKDFHYQVFDLNEKEKETEKENYYFIGYFQSYKYFEENYHSICKLLRLEKIRDEIMEKYKNTYYKKIEKTTSMHFRIGDYKKASYYHPIMPYEYYEKSLKTVLSRDFSSKKVLYFCEEEDYNDVILIIKRLENVYPEVVFVCVDFKIPDWEQMVVMSLCDHNIIANSTFSWWGAYFNTHSEKIVCFPDFWLIGHDAKDLCPPSWERIIC